MSKKIKIPLIAAATLIVLFAAVNVVGALNSSFLDAIEGLPLSDQILIIAKEVDRLKLKDELRDACDLTEDLEGAAWEVETFRLQVKLGSKGTFVQQMGLDEVKRRLEIAEENLVKYEAAKADCERLMGEFNQRYGE